MTSTPLRCIGGDCDGLTLTWPAWTLLRGAKSGAVIGEADYYGERTVWCDSASVIVLAYSEMPDDELMHRVLTHYWPSPLAPKEAPQ
jgi:hypothetical protein